MHISMQLKTERFKTAIGAVLAVGLTYLDHKRLGDGSVVVDVIDSTVGNSYHVSTYFFEGPWYKLRKAEDRPAPLAEN